MANPNIISVSNINGKTAVANITDTASVLLENPSASNKILKVNMMIIANKHSGVVEISVSLRRDSVDYNIAYNVVVPLNASLDLLSKPIYLQEGDSMVVSANVTAVSTVVCSYEEIY